MSYERLAYDDAATTDEMRADCAAAGSALRLPTRRTKAEQAAHRAVQPAPSISYDDFPREVPKASITVDEAAARLATAFQQS